MADHQPQALGWGKGGKGEGLLGDGGRAWGPGRGGGSRWARSHPAQVHTHHVRQPVAPGPVPVLLRGPVGTGGWAQGHQGLCSQAAVGTTATPLVQGDAGSAENGGRWGPPLLRASAPPGPHSEWGLRQPLEPEGRGFRASTTGQRAAGLAGCCGGPRRGGTGEKMEHELGSGKPSPTTKGNGRWWQDKGGMGATEVKSWQHR